MADLKSVGIGFFYGLIGAGTYMVLNAIVAGWIAVQTGEVVLR